MEHLYGHKITINGETRVLYHKVRFRYEEIDAKVKQAVSELKWNGIKRTYGDEWTYLIQQFGFTSASIVRQERLQWFNRQMHNKLTEKEDKGLWDDLDIYWLLKRLKDETCELLEAISIHRTKGSNREEIIREAADVANFAMMIADNARRLPK